MSKAKIIDEVEAFVKRVTYKPGNTLRVSFTPIGLMFFLERDVEDAESPGQKIGITGKRFLSWGKLDVEERERKRLYISVIHSLVISGEMHEAEEWLAVDGKKVFDPHVPRKFHHLFDMLFDALEKTIPKDVLVSVSC